MKVIHLVCARTWGGGERYALDLCRSLAAAGEDVSVISRGAEVVDTPFHNAGIPTRRLPLGGEFDIFSPLRLSTWLRYLPDRNVVIHVHNFKDASTAIKARALCGASDKNIRIVCTRHLAKPGKRTGRARRIYEGIDALIFVSEFAKKTFLEGNPEIDHSKIHVVHNSIIPPAEREGTDAASDRNPDEISLLYLGRISEEKGIDTMIRAVGLLGDLPLKLRLGGVGSGPYVKQLKGEVWRAGITDRVGWLGYLDDVYPEIRRADIGVVPSRWGEPFGLVLLEFMSQGVPVVTTGNGAQPEIIAEGREGFLVEPDDPQAMADAIRRLAADAALRREAGKRAKATFEDRFTYPGFLSKIRSIYRG